MSRSVRVALGTALVATLLVACRGGGGDEPDLELFTGAVGDHADDLSEVIAGFEEETGLDVAIVGSSELEVDLVERVSQGDLPDVALLPQPGLMAELASRAAAVPLPADVAAEVRQRQGEAATVGQIDGRQYGALARASVKGLLWYSPARLAERGLTVPTTLEDLQALVDAEAAANRPVWCLGLADGTASGWPGTDWIESLVLRRSGPEVYDDWVANEVRFDDPAIERAFRELDRLVLDGARLFGGRRRALSSSWQEAVAPLTSAEAGCVFLHQASFVADVADDVTIAPDGDLWVTPLPAAAGEPSRVEIAGDLAVALSDSPEAAQLVAWLTTPEAAARWPTDDGKVVPGVAVPDESSPFTAELLSIVNAADVVRFDASDLMVPSVGQGTFWAGMLRFVSNEPLDSVLAYIQSGYEESLLTPGG